MEDALSFKEEEKPPKLALLTTSPMEDYSSPLIRRLRDEINLLLEQDELM